ncbi:hypothetical protein [Novipirellula artificiosorum]|nr:hypothetical protein [Novipirellula artificiosorum]
MQHLLLTVLLFLVGTICLNNDSSAKGDKPPFKIKIRRFDDGVLATVASKDNCFEIELPKSFFEDESESVKISWIDFYR